MRFGSRLLFDVVARLALLFFAVYFAVTPEAMPGAPILARIGISALFLVLVVLTGELQAMRGHLSIVVSTILRAKGEGGAREPADDRAAVDILVKALRTTSEETKEKAFRQLRRLTGEDLPASAEAWEEWWKANREGFRRRG